MSLKIATFQIGTPRTPEEGLRLGTVRFLPRGVYKEDYARLDYFDVWLPVLAPSRDLMKRYKETNMQFATFARQYRKQMSETDPRQLIQLMAALAQETPVAIGCYCENESICHRSILSDLIREAAGVTDTGSPSEFCIYTIVHYEKLERALSDGGRETWEEAKHWTTGRELLYQAQAASQVMPILFADATNCSRLLYWAKLTSIRIGGGRTYYSFKDLKRIQGEHAPQELRLRESGNRIAPGFIRPYAICHTPCFLTD